MVTEVCGGTAEEPSGVSQTLGFYTVEDVWLTGTELRMMSHDLP